MHGLIRDDVLYAKAEVTSVARRGRTTSDLRDANLAGIKLEKTPENRSTTYNVSMNWHEDTRDGRKG